MINHINHFLHGEFDLRNGYFLTPHNEELEAALQKLLPKLFLVPESNETNRDLCLSWENKTLCQSVGLLSFPLTYHKESYQMIARSYYVMGSGGRPSRTIHGVLLNWSQWEKMSYNPFLLPQLVGSTIDFRRVRLLDFYMHVTEVNMFNRLRTIVITNENEIPFWLDYAYEELKAGRQLIIPKGIEQWIPELLIGLLPKYARKNVIVSSNHLFDERNTYVKPDLLFKEAGELTQVAKGGSGFDQLILYAKNGDFHGFSKLQEGSNAYSGRHQLILKKTERADISSTNQKSKPKSKPKLKRNTLFVVVSLILAFILFGIPVIRFNLAMDGWLADYKKERAHDPLGLLSEINHLVEHIPKFSSYDLSIIKTPIDSLRFVIGNDIVTLSNQELKNQNERAVALDRVHSYMLGLRLATSLNEMPSVSIQWETKPLYAQLFKFEQHILDKLGQEGAKDRRVLFDLCQTFYLEHSDVPQNPSLSDMERDTRKLEAAVAVSQLNKWNKEPPTKEIIWLFESAILEYEQAFSGFYISELINIQQVFYSQFHEISIREFNQKYALFKEKPINSEFRRLISSSDIYLRQIQLIPPDIGILTYDLTLLIDRIERDDIVEVKCRNNNCTVGSPGRFKKGTGVLNIFKQRCIKKTRFPLFYNKTICFTNEAGVVTVNMEELMTNPIIKINSVPLVYSLTINWPRLKQK